MLVKMGNEAGSDYTRGNIAFAIGSIIGMGHDCNTSSSAVIFRQKHQQN